MSGNETQLTPAFIVYLNDVRFSSDMESNVLEITVERRMDYTSSFSITLSDAGRKWTDNPAFNEGAKVRIMLGYKDAVENVIDGFITGISPVFRKNSDEKVIIRGNDILHTLHRGKKTRAFSKMKDSDIVKKIAGETGISADVAGFGTSHQFIMQNNQTDYEYLMTMCARFNCRMIVKDGKLLFKPAEDSSDEVIVEWGKSLIEFRPHLDITKLVTAVEVRGWDDKKGQALSAEAGIFKLSKLVGGYVPGGAFLSESFGEMKTIIVDDNITDKIGAEKAASDYLTANSMSYVTAIAKVQGNNKIKAGMIIQIKEVGVKFSGEYLVTEVIHNFLPDHGYDTRFKCQRNASGKR